MVLLGTLNDRFLCRVFTHENYSTILKGFLWELKAAAAATAKSLLLCSTLCKPQRRQPTRLPSPCDSPGKNTRVGCHFLLQCMKVKSQSEVIQSCPTLSNPMDCSLPGSSIHGIFQARVLEWGAIAFSIYHATCTQLLWYTTIQPSKKPRVLTETHINRVKKWQNSVQEVCRIEDSDFKTVQYRNGKNHIMWQWARELKALEEYRVLDMSAVEYGHELI